MGPGRQSVGSWSRTAQLDAELGDDPVLGRVASRAGRCQNRRIENVRIDQWLHAVRITTTRAAAAAACRGGHVTINGKPAKPSSPVHVGDRVEARVNRRDRVVEVTRLIVKRVGAAVATECYDDHSPPPPERDDFRPLFAVRDRGAGRPTKRDRRRIDRLRGRSP